MDRIAMNRKGWNYRAGSYQRAIGGAEAYGDLKWGPNRFPEDELKVLGNVRGKDVLEVGCGAAQFGIELAKRGARSPGSTCRPSSSGTPASQHPRGPRSLHARPRQRRGSVSVPRRLVRHRR